MSENLSIRAQKKKKKGIAKEECGEQIFEGPKYNGQGHLLRKSKN